MSIQQTDDGSGLIARLELRAAALREIRAYFEDAEFLEVQTPILLSVPGQETHIRPFQTAYHAPAGERHTCYLVTSPEHHMKRLLGCGCRRIFQISSCFRDGESSDLHLPEFTMVEWYRTEAGYDEVAEDAELLTRRVGERVFGRMAPSFRGRPVNLAGNWEHLTVSEAFTAYAGVDPIRYPGSEVERFRKLAGERSGVRLTARDSWEDVFYKLLLERVEPAIAMLGHPVFLRDYPASMAALARLSPGDPRVAERLELYIGGVELANGFSELNDGREQRRRFMAQRMARRRSQGPRLPLDEAFLRMLDEGRMPTAGGMALGLDRLIALLSGLDDVHQTCAFSLDRDIS